MDFKETTNLKRFYQNTFNDVCNIFVGYSVSEIGMDNKVKALVE